MRLTDIIMIAAVLLGPTAAVQVSTLLEVRREHRRRQLAVFRTLMTTRALTTSALHVEALNMIDVEFSSPKRKERAVRDAWKSYFDNLCTQVEGQTGFLQRQQLLVDVLFAMAKCLDYDLDKTHIKNTVYLPNALLQAEDDQSMARKAMAALLSGRISLPVHQVPTPVQSQAPQLEQRQPETTPKRLGETV